MLELNAEAANTELLVRYAKRLEQAKHGEKGAILAEVESFLGWKTDKFYRELKKLAGAVATNAAVMRALPAWRKTLLKK